MLLCWLEAQVALTQWGVMGVWGRMVVTPAAEPPLPVEPPLAVTTPAAEPPAGMAKPPCPGPAKPAQEALILPEAEASAAAKLPEMEPPGAVDAGGVGVGAIKVFAEVTDVDIDARLGGEAFGLEFQGREFQGRGGRVVVGAVHQQPREYAHSLFLVTITVAMQTDGCFVNCWKHVGI